MSDSYNSEMSKENLILLMLCWNMDFDIQRDNEVTEIELDFSFLFTLPYVLSALL